MVQKYKLFQTDDHKDHTTKSLEMCLWLKVQYYQQKIHGFLRCL